MEQDSIQELTGADALEWGYRGEGAGNIVLSYQGSNPLLVGKVLRLMKTTKKSKENSKHKHDEPLLSKYEQIIWAEWPSVAGATSRQTQIQAYARDVMRPLLGFDLVDPGVIVPVSSDFLETIASHVRPSRPAWRTEVSEIDFHSHEGLLLSDHSLFWSSAGTVNSSSTISVEIKPKCGFLPSSEFIAAENSVKTTVSRFEMHQVLKYSEGQLKSMSNYSPLDLFSGNLERISQAISDLFDNPQNNLRVFVNGKFFNSKVSDSDAETLPLKEALRGFISCDKQVDALDVLKSLISQSLYETDALSNLLSVQKLDIYDIEGAIHAYNKICEIHCDQSSICKLDEKHDKGSTIKNVHCGDNLQDCAKIVRDYLMAATAKDCSLMLTFQLVSDQAASKDYTKQCQLLHCSKTGDFYHLKIHFLDLDLKRLKKMADHYKLDQQIVKTYLNRG